MAAISYLIYQNISTTITGHFAHVCHDVCVMSFAILAPKQEGACAYIVINRVAQMLITGYTN
jgi:hypothetical protein